MPRIKNKNFETFNDGVIDVFYVEGREIKNKKLSGIRFGVKTVGISRFYEAKVAADTVDKLIAVHYNTAIERSNLIKIGEEQYKIIQIQEKRDTNPPTLYISLEKNNIAYRNEGELDGK